jgi:hypothetical protein
MFARSSQAAREFLEASSLVRHPQCDLAPLGLHDCHAGRAERTSVEELSSACLLRSGNQLRRTGSGLLVNPAICKHGKLGDAAATGTFEPCDERGVSS